ncbi:zinc finger CCCH domain-containing protein 67-like [Capsicum galapagoense]
MEEPIQQHQNQNQSEQLGLGLGLESRDSGTSSLPSDPNSQNPNQNQPKSDDHDDDEMAMQVICEELQNLILSRALDEEKGSEDRGESGRIEVENVEGNDDEGWGYEESGEFGYDQYDDEGGDGNRSGNEDDGGNENGYEGDLKEVGGFNGNRINTRKFTYPLRPDAQDCPYYMKTGMCKFGSNCKFNHPSRGKFQQGTKEKGKQREESQERPGQIECKYYLTSGGCKYGKACKFIHSREKGSISPIVEFNFLGLPLRPGERECPYYMRTGSCKYGSNCRFHHPDPITVAGADPSSGYNNAGAFPVQASSHSAESSWSPPRSLNDTASYAPMVYPPSQGIPSPNTEWNGYQAPVYPTSEKRLPTPPAFSMNNPTTKTNFYPRSQQPLLIEEYPERPGQPECSYFIKFGDCKYRSNCKFHHPRSRISKANSSTLNDKGLPLRPDQTVCSFYSRYGICKFGPACKFDHPENYVGGSAPSAESGFDQHQQSQMSLGWQGRQLEVDH